MKINTDNLLCYPLTHPLPAFQPHPNPARPFCSSAAGDVDVFQKASLTWRAMSKMDAPATSIAALDNDTVELIAQRFQVASAEVMRLNRGRISGLRPKAKMIEGTLILVPADAAAAPKGGKGKVKKKKGGKTGVTSATPTTKPFDSPFRPAKRRRGSNTPTTPPPVVTGRGSPKGLQNSAFLINIPLPLPPPISPPLSQRNYVLWPSFNSSSEC